MAFKPLMRGAIPRQPVTRAAVLTLVTMLIGVQSLFFITPATAQNSTATQQTASQAPADWQEKINLFKGSLRSDPELPSQWVDQVLSDAVYNARVKRLMTPAAGARSTVPDWQEYRARLVNSARIEAGVAFWRKNRQTLINVAQETGVPAEVIVGIIGIETFYGRNTGDIRVLDALSTLAFDYPATHPRANEREAYFRQELEQFLRLCIQNDLDPLKVRGSFAGAMGIPQFMPSSWMQYGEDFDKNGAPDLIGSQQDAIASVANYLRAHGWKPGKPAWYSVSFNADVLNLEELLKPDILPTFDAQSLARLGANIAPSGTDHQGLLALVKLRNGARSPEYIIGTENFYAVTRYNQSSYYALAVLELGAEVARRLETPAVTPAPSNTAP